MYSIHYTTQYTVHTAYAMYNVYHTLYIEYILWYLVEPECKYYLFKYKFGLPYRLANLLIYYMHIV